MRKNSNYSKFIFFVFTCIATLGNFAKAENDLNFQHLTVLDGLSHNGVTTVAQDSMGHIWFGTMNGLNRYDGYKIDCYLDNRENQSAVYNYRIRKMRIHGNYIWAVSNNGLNCFDIVKKKYIDFKEEGRNKLAKRTRISSEFIDSKERIWIGTKGLLEASLICKSGDEISLKKINIEHKLELDKNSTPRMVEFKNGRILVCNGDQLYEMISSQKDPLKISLTPLRSNFKEIQFLKTRGNELLLFLKNKVISTQIKNGALVQMDQATYPDCRIAEVAIYEKDIYVCSRQGLMKMGTKLSSRPVEILSHSFVDPFSVSSNHQSSVFIDNQNNLWVSTLDGGVSYTSIAKQQFNLVRYLPLKSNRYLSNEFVYSMHEDMENHILVGTKYGGISQFNPSTGTFDFTINLKNTFNVNAIVPCITSDDQWIYAVATTIGSSIIRINKSTKKVEILKSFPPSIIFSICFDNHHQLWVGVTGEGLNCLKIENGKVVNEKWYSSREKSTLKLSSNDIYYIYNDNKKNELLVSTSVGLNRLMLNNDGVVEKIAYYIVNKKKAHTLSSNFVWQIDKENDSTYWLGTMGRGLNRLIIGKRVSGIAKYRAENFGVDEGAPSNNMESVLVDKFGEVWCGGLYLSKFNYKRRKFKTYSEEDGLQSYQFATASSCKSKSGMLFFGGKSGMNYFMPKQQKEEAKLKISISRIYVNEKQVKVGDTINGNVVLENDLQYQKKANIPFPCNNLKIDFSSLTFTHKSQIQYRYKLVGFDTAWRYTDGKNTQGSYDNLPYKNYQFTVEVNNGEHWMAPQEKLLEIDVLPPWWRSIWAYLTYSTLILSILYFIIQYSNKWIQINRQILLQAEREKQKEELLKLRTEFFTNVSHEFKTPLTLMNSAISEIENEFNHLSENRFFKIFKRNNFKLIKLIMELMDFQRSESANLTLKVSEVNINQFINELFEEFQPWAEKSRINLQLQLLNDETKVWLDEEVFTKIFSNIVSNSLKNTNIGGTIEIILSVGNAENYNTKYSNNIRFQDNTEPDHHLIFTIRDNGIGIPPASLTDIFDRFQMIENNKSTQLGSGIGLSLVKTLVKTHRGALVVSSEEQVGTEFMFSIPLNDNYLDNNQKISPPHFSKHDYFNNYQPQVLDEKLTDTEFEDETKKTILLVDDNQEILMILKEHFKKDYNILLAENGATAFEICTAKQADLIISDVMMPIMNGLELCKKVKSTLISCTTPIILLTARGTFEQQIEGIEEGADAYIPKPFHLGLLESTAKNLINRATVVNEMLRQNTEQFKTNDTFIGEKRQQFIEAREQDFILKLTNFVENNLSNPEYSVDKLSLDIGMSRTKLYAQMKVVTNNTLGDFIREIRIQKAAELIRTTDFQISEVASKVGINSHSHFTLCFKDRFGISPTEYAKSYKTTQ